MNAIKTKLALMTPTQRRNMVVGVAAAVALACAGLWLATSGNSGTTEKKIVRPVKYSPLTGKINEESSIEALNARLKVMQESMNDMTSKQRMMESMLAANKGGLARDTKSQAEGDSGLTDAFVPPELRNYAANKTPKKTISEEVPGVAGGRDEIQKKNKERKIDVPQAPANVPNVTDANGNEIQSNSADSSGKKVMQQAPEALEIRSLSENRDGGSLGQANTVTRQEQSVLRLPAGTMLSGVLITGLDAPTGVGTMRQPVPALVRVKEMALMANGYRVDLRDCFIISAGYGSLGAEKAYIRSESISCVKQDGSVLEAQIDAYASGPDGKTGVPGRLVSKTGQLISQSLAAGMFGGLANASKSFRPPVIQLNGESNSSMSGTAQQALYDSMLSGLGTAASKVSDYFLEMLKEATPIVEVLPGTRIDFIVQRPVVMSGAPLVTKDSVARRFDSILDKTKRALTGEDKPKTQTLAGNGKSFLGQNLP